MPSESHLEHEYKFDVDADYDPPDLRGLVGGTERLPAQQLVTTYYDTPDLRLWARGITLRHRRGEGGESGKWTLKLPEAGPGEEDGVTRSEISWTGEEGHIPEEAVAVVRGLVRRGRLAPVVELSTERRRLLLHGRDADSAAWGEIDDDLVTVTRGDRTGFRFRQLEVEMLGDSPDSRGLAATVVRALRRAGAAPGGASKFALAAGLDGEGGGRPGPDSSRPADDAGALVAGTLAADLSCLLEWDYRLRVPDEAGDRSRPPAAAVQAARAALRRTRADVRLLEPVLDPVWAGHVRRDLRWMAGLLRRMCEEDTLAARIRGHRHPGDDEAVAVLIALLRADRRLDGVELTEALASDRWLDLLERLHSAAAQPPVVDADRPAAELLSSALEARWRAVRRAVEETGADAGADDLHHLRTLAQALRHAAESAEPYVGKPARRAGRRARRLQRVLGTAREADDAARGLRELATHPSITPAVAFVAGQLAGEAEAESRLLRRRWWAAATAVAAVKRLG